MSQPDPIAPSTHAAEPTARATAHNAARTENLPRSPLLAAAALGRELDRRWQAGDRVPVEEYLARLPGASPDASAAIDLIFTEYLIRERLGERPEAEEYARRFPDRAAVLRDQIALHKALATEPGLIATGFTDATAGNRPASPGAEQAPASLGRYVLRGVLGSGGMGVVHLADDLRLGRQVALKILRPDVSDPTATDRFHREAKLAAALNHPNLCPIFDFGRTGGVDYFTMPYIAGESLDAKVRRVGPLPPGEAVRLVRTIAEAMEVAHAAGVIHRDLKPANVILNERGEPVVTDFGLARRIEGGGPNLTGDGAIIGTPAYMPPEQVGATPEAIGPRSDVYSLGAILYELLAGRPPFTGRSRGEVLRRALTTGPAPLWKIRPGIPQQLDAICQRALAKDPAERFPSMAAFAAALEGLGSLRRRRRWSVGAGILAVAVGVALWASSCWPKPVNPPQNEPQAAPLPPPRFHRRSCLRLGAGGSACSSLMGRRGPTAPS